MKLVRVPVIKAFEHQGRPVTVGQSLELTPLDAAILARRGVVSLTRSLQFASPRRVDRPPSTDSLDESSATSSRPSRPRRRQSEVVAEK